MPDPRETMAKVGGANLSAILRFHAGWGKRDFAAATFRSAEVAAVIDAANVDANINTEAKASANDASTKHKANAIPEANVPNTEGRKLYAALFNRWKLQVEPHATVLNSTLCDRMHIGLGAGSVLETNVTLHPLHGYPWIPSTTIKGALRAYMESKVATIDEKQKAEWNVLLTELFGSADKGQETAGALIVHDGWWDPSSTCAPLVREVETPHHTEYYTGSQEKATDFDDPTPIAQMAVQGQFLFAIDHANIGPEWAELCRDQLQLALQENGLGGKTFAAGYGRFNAP